MLTEVRLLGLFFFLKGEGHWEPIIGNNLCASKTFGFIFEGMSSVKHFKYTEEYCMAKL